MLSDPRRCASDRSGIAVVELILVVAGGSYRLDLRGKDETPRMLVVMKRLDAEAISGAEQDVRSAIMDDECPHPVQALETLRPPLEITMEQDLGVTRRAKYVSA